MASAQVMYLGDGLLVGRRNPGCFEVRIAELSALLEVRLDSGQLRWLGKPMGSDPFIVSAALEFERSVDFR
jgi:hypothetical protein